MFNPLYSWDPELRLTPAEALNHDWILEVCSSLMFECVHQYVNLL